FLLGHGYSSAPSSRLDLGKNPSRISPSYFAITTLVMFAALHLVDLVALAAMKECPSLWRKPFGVMALQEKALVERVKLPLLAVNDAARRAGIDAGWPLNRALVRCPDLRILPPQPRHEAALL